jgi:hypothetical protein
MDPIATIQSAITLAMAIRYWVEAQQEKEQVIKSIAATTTRLCDVLTPFNDREMIKKLDGNVVAGINGLKDALLRTKEHLVAYGSGGGKGKKGSKGTKTLSSLIVFFVPSEVIKSLKQDEQDLHNQLVGMLFVLAVNNLVKETKNDAGVAEGSGGSGARVGGGDPPSYEVVGKTVKEEETITTTQRAAIPDQFFQIPFKNDEVGQFWKDYIGAKVSLISYPLTSVLILDLGSGDVGEQAHLPESPGGIHRKGLERPWICEDGVRSGRIQARRCQSGSFRSAG